jgi:DNA topoisomerase II
MSTPKYTHLSQRNQILKRPGQHIGSAKSTLRPVWLAETTIVEDSELESIVEREIIYNSGLMHIFYEVLGNAQDNYFRSRDSKTPLKKIEVTVDSNSGQVTVWNDGLWIPTVIHKWDAEEEKIDDNPHYEAEIIFGHLNSSSNYDDQTVRVGGGLHGVGVKLTNIFSKEFMVDCFDPETQQRICCSWSNNMNTVKKPKITKLKQKKGYTQIKYIADFARFGVQGYDLEHLAVMKKLCIDCAMITGQKVVFNGETIPVKDLKGYADYYTDGQKLEFKTAESTVVLCEKQQFEPGLAHVSFVNGINTNKGGIHLDEWKKQIFKHILEQLRGKYSSGKKSSVPFKLTPKNLEQYFMIFVNCTLDNPEFEGQTKNVLIGPAPKVSLTAAKLKPVLKWKFVQDIDETMRLQGLKELKKTDGKKATSVSIQKAIDANKAGSSKSSQCTLFITEGDSAKAFAVKGISAIEHGTDWFGVLPVRGKFLNVRGASPDQINNNKEVTQLKTILGLRHAVDYQQESEFKTLRYGKVRILTDADPDGDHIKGLLINYFQYFYPSLVAQGYITSQRTPIVKAQVGKKVYTFYYVKDFKKWAEKQTGKYTAKYYKGLGTSKDDEILEIFQNPRFVQFVKDDQAAETVAMLFDKGRADDRKRWLENYQESEFVYPEQRGIEQVPISSFINQEMVGFSIYDNHRSVPSMVDGFKPSQRKAMWVALKTLNQSTDYKIAQFAAEVAKQAEYHHGETSMEQAIIGMAQTFVGANNIALLYEAGQLGTRLAGGKDAAASRYIYTHLTSIARFVLRKEDDPILDYLEDEGKKIEPKYFVPVLPMLLVNGCVGIGTGYSSHIPAFNPHDLVKWIRIWLDKNSEDKQYPTLSPWYNGFKGLTTVDPNEPQRFFHTGLVEAKADHVEITELPVRVWTDDYKDHLDALKSGVTQTPAKNGPSKSGYDSLSVSELREEIKNRGLKGTATKKGIIERLKEYDKEHGTTPKNTTSKQTISRWEWHGDAYNVRFKIWPKAGIKVDPENPVFKLKTSETLTNMTAFTPTGGMKKYSGVNEIMQTFCELRFEYYQKRKKYLLRVLEDDLREYESKARFIDETLKNFSILKQTETQLFGYLEKKGYWKKNDSYDYLISMQVRSFTADKRDQLLAAIKKLKEEIEWVKKKSPRQMWLAELDEFVKAYDKWIAEIDQLHKKIAGGKKIKI